MRRMRRIAPSHFGKCAPFVSKMNNKNFVYSVISHYPLMIDDESEPADSFNNKELYYATRSHDRLFGGAT